MLSSAFFQGGSRIYRSSAVLIPGCPRPWLPSSQVWAQTFSQVGFPIQRHLLSQGLILTQFAKPPSLPWGAALPGTLEAACDGFPSLSSSSTGGAGTRAGSHAPPKSTASNELSPHPCSFGISQPHMEIAWMFESWGQHLHGMESSKTTLQAPGLPEAPK